MLATVHSRLITVCWLVLAVLLVLSVILSATCYAFDVVPLDIIEPIWVPKNTSAYIVADDGYAAYGEYGCNDNWSEFRSDNWALPAGVWSTNNLVNQLAITYHGGLNGYTRINAYGQVVIKLCITDAPGANPKSVHVLY